MVRLSTFIAIGGLVLAFILFQGAGGAAGIGSRIGGGFQSFTSALTSGIIPAAAATTAANPLQAPANLTGQPPAIGLNQLQSNLQQTQGALQGINNFFSNLFGGSLFNPSALNLQKSFNPSAIQQRISFEARGRPRTQFGGFLSAEAQEIGLQQAVTASQQANPSFFKL